MREPAFWDTSALVPLCIQQRSTSRAGQLTGQFGMTVWWAAPVEARSVFAREARGGLISDAEHQGAILRLEKMCGQWEEIKPDDAVRSFAEDLPDRFSLRAADALQLAAAYIWTMRRPSGRPFICGDKRLLGAAAQMGFRAMAV